MKYVLITLAVLLAAYALYECVRITRLIAVGGGLVEKAVPFQRTEGSHTMLVLGDSTAVGVGAREADTVASRLGNALDASVENHASSGARTADITTQFEKHRKDKYDIVLIQIGANDVIRFSKLEQLRDDVSFVLKDARTVSDHVVLLTAGKVGNAPLFPRAFGWLWTKRAEKVRAHFMAAAEKYDALYVDLFAAPDPFAADPVRYYAADGLHLTGDGYGFWYEETAKEIEEMWPGFLYGR